MEMIGSFIIYLSKMNFNRLIKDSKEGLKRKISSRRERISVSVFEFNNLSKKYFNQIKEGKSLHFQNEKNWGNKNRIKKEEWEIWKKELISEHGEIIGSKLADGELAVGMNYDHVVIWWGSEEDKKISEAINKKEITKLYFGESKNRLGNEKFSYEVTLENGKVVGWTDLKNRRSQRS